MTSYPKAPLCFAALLAAASAYAQQAPIQNAQVGSGLQVVAGGQVADDATRLSILAALRKVYGADNVVDRIDVVNAIESPANWSENIAKLLTAQLRQIRKGQLQVNGTQLVVNGEVADEATRQKLLGDMAGSLNPTYTIRSNLLVPAAGSQQKIDQLLLDRSIEFETGSATLTERGKQVLDVVVPALAAIGKRKITVLGHTDDSGDRRLNLTLSQARADAVKGYLVDKGIDPYAIATSGVGPDQPIASNESTDGRAKNRRIEFRVGDR